MARKTVAPRIAIAWLHRRMFPLYDDNPTRRTPVVVLWFILLNLAVLLVELTLPGERAQVRFAYTWGLVPAALWEGPYPHVWLTPITSMFMHGGWAHLLGNCWFFWLFGNNIEDRLGHLRFIAFYLLCGLAAAAAQVLFSPHSAVPMVGASGAISGVLGAYMRYFPGTPVYSFIPPLWVFPVPAFIFIALWFVLQFWQGVGSIFATGVHGGVAWWAHVGGFLAGFVLAGAMRPRATRRAR
jgi:membrane associated rhomboid family serine protease